MYFGAMIGSIVGVPVLQRMGRRRAFALAFIGALAVDTTMFLCTKSYGTPLLILTFIVGLLAVLPFLWLFISVPELYPKRIRGTAFGISIQTGRTIAAVAAIAGGQMISACHGSYAIAGSCIATINVLGFVGSFFIPREENYLSAAERLEQSLVPRLDKTASAVGVSSG
jgi:predicted MFS family arabinose efflux permease